MADRRSDIAMSPGETAAFLSEGRRSMMMATAGPRGWPHVMPMWFVMRGEDLCAWTYAKSQKVRNLERDDRATVQVEDGTRYDRLRGVMIEARTEVIREEAEVYALALEIYDRYEGETSAEERSALLRQAPKRVGLRFKPLRTMSWDHAKLHGGGY
jgi:PPOX class probable F420-dependent enzyme